jgi:hypothetical protein
MTALEYGVTYSNVLPSLCYAFGLQIYMLPISKTLERDDVNGKQGFKVGLTALLFLFLSYLFMFLITLLYNEPHHHAATLFLFDIAFNSPIEFSLPS